MNYQIRKTFKTSLLILSMALVILSSCKQKVESQKNKNEDIKIKTNSLKEAYKDKFMIGAALGAQHTNGEDTVAANLIASQYNTIVAENCMKSEVTQPQQGVFDFKQSDEFVKFGEANNMFIIGHTLVWHSQAPNWIFVDDKGNDVSRDTLIARMKDHIYTLVGHYKGRVNGWDVVNEAIDDKDGLRKSKWYQIIGEDFIELAFKFAHEADPDAELYYNDYSMIIPHRRDDAIKLIKNLQEKGLKIDGIGMQAHYGLDINLTEFEKSIVEFGKLGVKVMLTELDISVIPFPEPEIMADISKSFEISDELNPFPNELPDSIQNKLADTYSQLFKIMLKHNETISRVTFWGVNDKHSWRNNWPIKGRTDYPLIFDRNNQPKPAFEAIIKLMEK